MELLASPIGTVHERYLPNVADVVAQTAAEHGAREIVLGLPRNMDGSKAADGGSIGGFTVMALIEVYKASKDEKYAPGTVHIL